MSNYWEQRFITAQQKIADKSIEEIQKQITKYYRQAAKKTINDFIDTYKHIQSMASEDKAPTPADLYNLDRYWQMQKQLRDEMKKLNDDTIATLGSKFEETFKEVYDSLSIPSSKVFITVDTNTTKHILDYFWTEDGRSFSDRVWENTKLLSQQLNNQLVDSIITGRSSRELKRDLIERFNVSYARADTLIRTETANIQTQAAMARYRDSGVKNVHVIIEDGACEECQELADKVYTLDMAPRIPVHPNCRCCISPVIEVDI